MNSVVQVKVAGDEASIRSAAEHFLSKDVTELSEVVRQILIRHLQIVGMKDIGEMEEDRVAAADQVKETLAEDLKRMGLEVISLNLNEIKVA